MVNSITKRYKSDFNANPLSDQFFCADPTAVEYEGRLYVYGTNDHQQYENTPKNTYEKIRSFQIFSTDDMVNWRYEGIIDTDAIAPWVWASWAPSICKRVEEDGLTHFYLYFSNSGAGVGVLTATNPAGPWTSPLSKSLVDVNTPGLKDCPNPFDPGVCIDENGTGWLSFGGGNVGGDAMPGTMRIVKLGKDMISLDSEIVTIKAPYSFEASELNYINGTYVYTFNSNWVERNEWTLKAPKSSACSMCYMTTKTPLVSDSWVYRDDYFANPGIFGMEYSNNHTHLEKFGDKWYLFYHAMILQKEFGTEGGFRSLCVNEIEIDEKNVKIKKCTGNRDGAKAVKNHSAYEKTPFAEVFNSREIAFEKTAASEFLAVKPETDGAWLQVKNVDFEDDGTKTISLKARGSGVIQIHSEKLESEPVVSVSVDNTDWKELTVELPAVLSGVKNLYFVFGGNLSADWWKFNRN